MGSFLPVPPVRRSQPGQNKTAGPAPRWINDKVGFGRPITAAEGYNVIGTTSNPLGGGGTGVPGYAGGGGYGGGSGDGSGGGTTNTSEASPTVQEHIQNYRDRLSADTTKRAIDRSNLGVADSAALLASDAKANMSRRGVLGSGTGDAFLNKRVFEPAQRQAAAQAANISLQRERDLDALVLGGTGIMRLPDEIALANRGLNLEQLRGDREDQRYRGEIEREERRRREDAARWQAMLSNIGEYQ
jgi:hypothetical protein